jgi:hypothetical protein
MIDWGEKALSHIRTTNKLVFIPVRPLQTSLTDFSEANAHASVHVGSRRYS